MNEKGLQLELVNNLLKKMETERLSYEEYRNLQYVLIKYSIFYIIGKFSLKFKTPSRQNKIQKIEMLISLNFVF